MRCLRIIGFSGLANLAIVTAAVAPQAAAALSVPKAGVIEVTGYRQPGISGSSGPVVVVANRRQAAALRVALKGLVPWSSESVCDNALGPFVVSILPRKGVRPTLVATAYDCGSTGEMLVNLGKPSASADATLAGSTLPIAVSP